MGLFRKLAAIWNEDASGIGETIGSVFESIGSFFRNKFGKGEPIEPPPGAPIGPPPIRPPGSPPDDFDGLGGPPGEDDFIFRGAWILTPNSTNVHSFNYEIQNQELVVGYVGWRNHRDESKLRYYKYSDVEISDARAAFQAASSDGRGGGFVWDYLRERGSQCNHRKKHRYILSAGGYNRKRPCP